MTRGAAVLSLLVGMLFSWAAAAVRPLSPELQERAQWLVDGAPTLGEYAIDAVVVAQFAVEIRLRGNDGSRTVELRPRDAEGNGRKVGATRSFSVWVDGEGPAVDAAVRELVGWIDSRDDGTFFARPDSFLQVEGTARDFGVIDGARRFATWLALLLVLAWVVVRHGEVRWFVAVAVLGGVAVAIRLFVPPWAPLHGNAHGIAELRGLAVPYGAWNGPVDTDRYGVAYRQIVRAIIGRWDGGARSALAFGAVAGGLCAIPMTLLASVVCRSRSAGLLAGLALAVHPAHVALSLSEGPMPLAGLLMLIGLACAVRVVPGMIGAGWLAWASGLALACAAELSVASMFLALAAVCAMLPWQTARRRLLWPGAVLALVVALHAYALGPVFETAIAEHRTDVLTPSVLWHLTGSSGNLMLDSSLSPFTLPWLSLAGFGALIARGRRAAAAGMVILALTPVIPAMAVMACRADLIRYETVACFGLLLMAAALPACLGRHQSVAMLVVTGLLLGPSVAALRGVRAPSLDAQAFALADEALARLPADALIRIAPRRDGLVLNDFPEYLGRSRGRAIRVDDDGSLGGDCHVWLGPSCYSFTSDEVANGALEHAQRVGDAPIRQECWRPIQQIDSRAAPDAAAVVSVPRPETEFFQIPGRELLIGMFPCSRQPIP